MIVLHAVCPWRKKLLWTACCWSLGYMIVTTSSHQWRKTVSCQYKMCVRPDIWYAVGYLGRFQNQPGEAHWQSLKRVVRYLKGTKNLKLQYKKNDMAEGLVGFADTDWQSDTEDRKSVSGCIFKVWQHSVLGQSEPTNRCTVVMWGRVCSLKRSGFRRTMAVWTSWRLWSKFNLAKLSNFLKTRGCIAMATNTENKRVKHIDVKHHFLRDHQSSGTWTFPWTKDTCRIYRFRAGIGIIGNAACWRSSWRPKACLAMVIFNKQLWNCFHSCGNSPLNWSLYFVSAVELCVHFCSDLQKRGNNLFLSSYVIRQPDNFPLVSGWLKRHSKGDHPSDIGLSSLWDPSR